MRPFFLVWDRLEPFEAAFKLHFGSSNSWREILKCFPQKYFQLKKDINIVDDKGVSTLSVNVCSGGELLL